MNLLVHFLFCVRLIMLNMANFTMIENK